jgi:ATP-binding protein involved in chromosome partitioning
MTFDKQAVLIALKTITAPGEAENMVDSGVVKNVVIFGDEVVVDVTISNPTLQAKKRIEVDIMKTIHQRRPLRDNLLKAFKILLQSLQEREV